MLPLFLWRAYGRVRANLGFEHMFGPFALRHTRVRCPVGIPEEAL